MEFLRFIQVDPHYGPLKSEVVVAVAQIVKIEPVYYEPGKDGGRYRTHVEKPTTDDLSIGREFVITDSRGNQYASETASPEARKIIEQLWNDAK